MRRYRKPNHYLQLTLSHRPNASQQAQATSARVSDRRALKAELELQIPKPTYGHRKEGTKGYRPIKAVAGGKGMTKAVRLAPVSVSGPSGGMGWFSRQIKQLASAPTRLSNWDRLPPIYRSQLYGYSRRYDL